MMQGKYKINDEVCYDGYEWVIDQTYTTDGEISFKLSRSVPFTKFDSTVVVEISEKELERHLSLAEKIEPDAIKPDHYKIGELIAYKVIQAISSIYPAGLGFYVGNIIKYVFRAPRKNGVEDLKKAREYLDQLIEGYEES